MWDCLSSTPWTSVIYRCPDVCCRWTRWHPPVPAVFERKEDDQLVTRPTTVRWTYHTRRIAIILLMEQILQQWISSLSHHFPYDKRVFNVSMTKCLLFIGGNSAPTQQFVCLFWCWGVVDHLTYWLINDCKQNSKYKPRDPITWWGGNRSRWEKCCRSRYINYPFWGDQTMWIYEVTLMDFLTRWAPTSHKYDEINSTYRGDISPQWNPFIFGHL